jgi:hypothetical protein
MVFKNISVFKEIGDYLSILNGVLLTDLIVIAFLLAGWINSKVLNIWYKELSLSAVIADILIIFIGIIIARFLYPYIFTQYSLLKFLGLAVGIQVVHDTLFYQISLAVPRGQSRIMDIFKDYGKEKGFGAILADSAMIITAILIASILKGLGTNVNIITLVVAVYLVPYFIYSL